MSPGAADKPVNIKIPAECLINEISLDHAVAHKR